MDPPTSPEVGDVGFDALCNLLGRLERSGGKRKTPKQVISYLDKFFSAMRGRLKVQLSQATQTSNSEVHNKYFLKIEIHAWQKHFHHNSFGSTTP